MDFLPFIPGVESEDKHPLARFLPPVPGGVGAEFLARHAVSREWVLDPFGAAPSLAVELARNGKNVLVAVNNPVTRFLLELVASPPPIEEIRAALSDLAATRKGNERLETHLQSLYLTECSKCQRQVPVEAFIWEKGASTPSGRIYTCVCGESGEFPTTETDQENATRIAATDHLHRARALERVAAPDDPDRPFVVQALECYLPRAVYTLITIINKLDSFSLDLPKERRRALLALILAACDEANTLWPHPTERPRPKQLIVPPRYLEKNIWLVLERAVKRWGTETPIQTTDWTSASPGNDGQQVQSAAGGVYVFEGPVRSLVPALKAIPIGAVVTTLPRPNQAFWTLSALWAGWLWGRAAAAPFKSILRRRRFDWNWHTAALHAALKNISPSLPLTTPLFALLPEPEPAFLSAALLAAASAGFDLESLAMRTRHDALQISWRRRAFLRDEKEPSEIDPQSVLTALETCLRERGEPAPYLLLHAAGLASMAADHSLRWQEDAIPTLNAPLQTALTNPVFLQHSESTNPETGLWGLETWEAGDTLPDRVEIALVRLLHKNPGLSFLDMETSLNNEFPGLLTPSLGILRAILASYAVENAGGWTLRLEDSPSVRRADLDSATESLAAISSLLGFTSTTELKPWRVLRWLDGDETAYTFHILASAVIGKILRSAPGDHSAGTNIIVMPGGRASLLSYKLSRDPGLRASAEAWRVVKLRQLRRIAGIAGVTRAGWEKELNSDPLEPPEQMKLF